MKSSRPAVVFVNYHSESLISGRAAALLEDGIEVIVIDNSGTYRGPGYVHDPGLNLGFGAACNLALRHISAGVRCLVLHNPDVSASPAHVIALAEIVERQRRPGLAAPVLQVDGLGRLGYHYPSVAREFAASVRVGRSGTAARPPTGLVARLSSRGKRFGSGALLAVSTTALRLVGGFDERFFLYVEDCDLWHRFGRAHRDRAFASDLVVEHQGKSSGGGMDLGTRELLRWLGIELFASKHHGQEWHIYRRVHERALPQLVANEVTLAGQVAEFWQAGLDPVCTAVRIRRELQLRR